MERYHNINGQLVPATEASLKVNDLAILRGFGIFDYFLVIDQVPLFIADYMDRFYQSATRLNLEVPVNRPTLQAQIQELIQVNGEQNGAIRLVLTGGYASDSYTPVHPNLLILFHDFKPAPATYYQEGIKLLTHEFSRDLPEVKTINYATGIRLLPQLKAAGAMEPLYHSGGTVQEATRSNFFLLTSDRRLITTNKNILFGITRKHVLEAVAKHFQIEERIVQVDEIWEAAEAFVTGSNKGVMPVTRIDEHQFGNGRPGPMVQEIMEHFSTYKKAYVTAQQKILT